MSRTFSVRIQGLDALIRQLDPDIVSSKIDRVSETYARKMANASAGRAPVKDGWLRNSIIASVSRESEGVWRWGSDLPYALRQEYENPTKRGFVRITVYEFRNEYRDAVKELLKELGAR